jgi:hypothetical protein
MELNMKAFLSFGLCLALLGTACGSGDSNGSDSTVTDTPTLDGVTDTPTSDGVTDDSTTSCEVEPTLSSLQAEYFNKSCSFSSCHGSTINPKGGLDLRDGMSFDALVGVSALFGPGKQLVVPNDPDNSFLVQKVEGPADGEGEIMPTGVTKPLDPNCRIKALRDWIAAGAQDN